jgi:altronate dehydratase
MGKIRLLSDIPMGHKFALRAIARNADVIKYGAPIGRATATIAEGEYVHVHNVVSHRGRKEAA